MVKACYLITKPEVLDHIDNIERAVLEWESCTKNLHKYGGLEFNCNGKQIGHIHSNGLLDIPFNKYHKKQLLRHGRVVDHHVFDNSGWISFYVKTQSDKEYALKLLKLKYQLHQKRLLTPSRDNQAAAASIITMLT